ncbi:MAG TPA: hypothetical protein VN654_22210 [Vicinamibacterales bacterium]|jgi:hypothetical protein|nr:hypothetical protein [Vicinamibacterales bacterium]
MQDRQPDPKHNELFKRLDELREEVAGLRQRIESAQDEDRRRTSRPFSWPDRRKTAA